MLSLQGLILLYCFECIDLSIPSYSNISNFTRENTLCTELRENSFQHAKKMNSLGDTVINKFNFPEICALWQINLDSKVL